MGGENSLWGVGDHVRFGREKLWKQPGEFLGHQSFFWRQSRGINRGMNQGGGERGYSLGLTEEGTALSWLVRFWNGERRDQGKNKGQVQKGKWTSGFEVALVLEQLPYRFAEI